jgi:hypothetical protein
VHLLGVVERARPHKHLVAVSTRSGGRGQAARTVPSESAEP